MTNVIIYSAIAAQLVAVWASVRAERRRVASYASVSPILIFSALHIMFFIVKPVIIVVSGYRFLGDEVVPGSIDPESLVVEGVCYSFVFQTLFYFGFFSRRAGRAALKLPTFRVRASPSLFRLIVIAYVLLLIFYLAYVTATHGAPPLWGSVSRTELVKGAVGKLAFVIILAASPVVALLAFTFFNGYERASGRVTSLKLSSALLFALIIFCLALLGSRTRVFTMLIIAGCTLAFYRRVPELLVFGAGTALFLLAYLSVPIVSVYHVSGSLDWREIINVALQQRNGDKFDNFLVVVASVRDEGISAGRTSLGFLSEFLPFDSIFGAPFLHETKQFMQEFFPVRFRAGIGYPVPLIASSFWNFHVAGLSCAAVIFGAFYRIVYDYAVYNRGWAVPIYAMLSFSMYGVVFGSFANSVARDGVRIILLIVILSAMCGFVLIRAKKFHISRQVADAKEI